MNQGDAYSAEESVKLHHVALGANDVETVAGFYCDLFDLAELRRHTYASGELRSIWLDLGAGVLMIEHTERTRARCEGVDAGTFLLAFERTPEERVVFEQRLDAAGIAVESRSDFSTYFRDPEGNRVAVSCYPLA